MRLSIHRAVPGAAQLTAKAAAFTRGSPSGTIASENRAVTWRTLLTVPCGENDTTEGAGRAAYTAPQTIARAASSSKLTMKEARGRRLIGADCGITV